ncbi:MAG: VWA domain-containing protein [Woeseiaceae bacterium]|nr:VWA domain-containing protein [Woeseiaceae bacterium]
MPADFHFLRPEWLFAMPAVVIVTLWLARRQLAPGSWQRIVDPGLAPHVLSRRQMKGAALRWWLVFLGGVLATLSLAGPSWNRVEQPVFRSEQAIVVALDLSRSMDAQDVSPSRLARAKLKILDILERRSSGQTALIVYSANAFTVTPLTTDADTVAALVNSLGTDIMPSRGSYPVAAIRKGQQLLEQAGVLFGEILLITDSGASPGAIEAAEELREAGYTLSVLGVGTLDGAPIPRAGGGFVTDRSGQIVVPRLDPTGLQQLAAAGGGRYSALTADEDDLDRLLSGEVGGGASTDQDLATDQWQEEGPWLLLLLVPLASLAFRKGWVLTALVFVAPLASEPVHALSWQDLWKTPDQQGRDSLEAGDANSAAQQFEDREWRAVANYRAGDYAESAAGFARSEDADGYYNYGNALARLGEFEAALDAYDRALEIDPDAEDARHNRDLIEELMQQQDSQSGDQGEQQQSQEGGGAQQSEGDSQSDEANQESQAGDTGEESPDSDGSPRDQEMSDEDLQALEEELQRAAQQAEQQAAEGEQEMDQAMVEAERRAQEQQAAMEQWLRRIPDDPGGLLRRKFRYQYQRQGRDQDGNNLWPDDEVEPW